MQKNKICLNLDINNNKIESVILKQYNKDSQWVVINVTENGKPFILDENNICIFKMKTPDGREIYNDAVLIDNTVIVEVTQNCCTCNGTGEAELNIVDEESGSQIATMNFYVTIEASVYDNEDIQGSTEYGALVDRIAKADAVIAKTDEIIHSTAAAAAAAADSANLAKASEENAKASETNSQDNKAAAEYSANEAKGSASAAKDSADAAAISANDAGDSADSANGFSAASKNYAKEAYDSKIEAKSYAHGGTESRENEDVDNAKYYYEQARGISEGLQGSLLPMGTITFSQLETSTKQSGYMYNISDEFTTDDTFKEGAGYTYPAGTNVYYTADGYWDCLAGTQVTGVKGNAESSYRKGNVNITPENINALPLSGGTLTSSEYEILRLKRTGSDAGVGIKFENSNGTLGSINMSGGIDTGLRRNTADGSKSYTFLDTGNFKAHVTPTEIGALSTTGNSANNTVTFTSYDTSTKPAYSAPDTMTSGETHSSLFSKISRVFRNVRYLYSMIGTTDISSIGGGTATGAISQLDTNIKDLIKIANYTNQSTITIAANSSIAMIGDGSGIDLMPYIPTGYKAIGVSSFIMTRHGILYSRIQVDNYRLWYQLQNLNNNAVTLGINEVSLYLLCMKSL